MNPKINENIKSWWNQLPNQLKGTFPTFVHNLNPKAEILFVGFNPAGSLRDTPKRIEDLTAPKIDKIIEKEKGLIGFWESTEKCYWRYYKVFHTLRRRLNAECEYVDLFQMRYSESDKLLKIMQEKGVFLDFHKEHINNFDLIIKEIPNLKFIVLNNANSARLIQNYYGSNMEFDSQKGLYKISNPKEIYFYLQGSMQYGRSTVFDQERIEWFFQKIR